MTKPIILEVTAKPIAPEVLAAFKNGRLDIRSIPKTDSGSYQLQAWAVAIFGPTEAASYAFGSALKKIGLVLGQRTKRFPNDPGGDDHNLWAYAFGQGEPRRPVRDLNSLSSTAFEAIAEGTIEELEQAGHKPRKDYRDAGIRALSEIMLQMYKRALAGPKPAPKAAPVTVESKSSIKTRFLVEQPKEDEEFEIDDPPTVQVSDAIREKMINLMTDTAKNMMSGDKSRLIALRYGNQRTVVGIRYDGIREEDGLPVAYITAGVNKMNRDAEGDPEAMAFATVKLFYEIPTRHVTRMPIRDDIWAEIAFTNAATRGRELSRAFADWVYSHRPNRVVGYHPQKGTPRNRPNSQPVSRFVNTNIVVPVTGFKGVKARLAMAPIMQRVRADNFLVPGREFSLHRTAEKMKPQELENYEEQILISANALYEKDGRRYTLYGLKFGDQFKERVQQRHLVYALIQAIHDAANQVGGKAPTEFVIPTSKGPDNKLRMPILTRHIASVSKAELDFWHEYEHGSQEQDRADAEVVRRRSDLEAEQEEQERVIQDAKAILMVHNEVEALIPNVKLRGTVINLAIQDTIRHEANNIDINNAQELALSALNSVKNYVD